MPELDDVFKKKEKRSNEIEIIVDENFSYDGYQVVRSEFFAHMREPGITFNNCKVNLNTACIRRLPEVDYVQFLVNPNTKTLVIQPCSEEDKDSFLWCITKPDGKRTPRYITCKVFFAMMAELMDWNPEYRYKMIGKIISKNNNYLIVFDLKSTEVFQHINRKDGTVKPSRNPSFPAEWRNQFGLPVEEHKKLLQVNIFDGYTVFGVKDKRENHKNKK